MKNKLFNVLTLSTALLLGVTSCGSNSNNNNNNEVCGLDTEYDTPVTDAFTFKNEASIRNNNFLTATSGLAISEVSVASFTDGDTTTFKLIDDSDDTNNFKVRYQAINTPESTGKIEEWGIKASHFTKSKLKSASRIVVLNDLTQFAKTDSSGGRYMGFVWYLSSTTNTWRLLNLEIVEQGYSSNQLQQDSSILTGYYEAFKNAAVNAKSRRVNGEKDCDFDSSSDVIETTIYNAKKNFDTLGVDDSTSGSGKMLRITAVVTALAGNDFYCRDLILEEGESVKTGIFVFTGYQSTGVKVGDVIRFYARITRYYGNYQMTDLKVKDTTKPFEILSTEEINELGYEVDNTPYVVDASTINSLTDLDIYLGNKIETTFKVSDRDDYLYESTSSSTTFTMYGSIGNTSINIRFDSHPFFSTSNTIKRVFSKGESYKVVVLLNTYQYSDSESLLYQAEFPNFKATEYKNYVSKIN